MSAISGAMHTLTSRRLVSPSRPPSSSTVRISEKTKAQYQTTGIAASDARRAIEQATRLYNAAQRIVTS